MVPTVYRESSSRSSRANSPKGAWRSPTMATHCSRAPQKMSQSWLYSRASSGSPWSGKAWLRAWRAWGAWIPSKNSYSAITCWPMVSPAAWRRASKGAITCRRRALSSSSAAWSSGVKRWWYPPGWRVHARVHRLP